MLPAPFPLLFEQSLQADIGTEAGALLQALRQPTPVSIRYNERKPLPAAHAESLLTSLSGHVPWCAAGVYLEKRPAFTLDPSFHSGAYYVQEASSMFLAQLSPLFPDLGDRLRVLDLCAAPGGKSTLLTHRLPADALLVSNEVIRSRTAILLENLTKWGYPNTVITGSDPKQFGDLPAFFDLLLVDAPCSGEGMFRKDPAAVREWSPAYVQLCADRQRRIVADAWPSLREGGLLVYSTCTFNRRENEDNVQWIIRQLGAAPVTLPLHPSWGVVQSDGGYRFYPHRIQGEGFFVSVLRKTAPSPRHRTPSAKESKRKPLAGAKPWNQWLTGDFIFDGQARRIYALPAVHSEAIGQLAQSLAVWQAGTPLGEWKGRDLSPSAALALSTACHREAFPCIPVDLPTALAYLRRESIHFPDAPNGFLLLCYRHIPIGWAKKIGDRTNNLFPLPWRIRQSK